MLHINNSSYQGYFITMTKIPRTLHIYDISYQGYFMQTTTHTKNTSYRGRYDAHQPPSDLAGHRLLAVVLSLARQDRRDVVVGARRVVDVLILSRHENVN